MIFLLIKILIGVGCISALFYYDFIDFDLLQNAATSPVLVGVAFACLLSTVFIGALRWKVLMGSLHVRITFIQSLNYTFIGQFFNVFLPGAYGGDFVRGGLAYRQHKDKIGEIMMSSLVDRLTGLAGLLFIAVTVLAFIPNQFQFWIGVIVVSGLVVGFFAPVIAVRFQSFFRAIITLFPRPVARILMGIFDTIVDCFETYGKSRGDLIKGIALSVFQYVLILEALYLLGNAMGVSGLSPVGYVVSSVAGLFANAIPLSPGGLGIGEAAFGQVARLLEKEPTTMAYSSIFLLMRTLTLFTSVFGVIPFLLHREAVQAVREEKEHLQKNEG
ncbi:lysylphosphatidylglycerol synthase transmembrane domain-containing protein [Sneathiella sp.]|uniref:lysylphosphatidylglycerol synthase transmembrane domain-containing protein n=1 Tax=Sneathiella sp. TaxID=1964365 RepID=UPI0039E71AA4